MYSDLNFVFSSTVIPQIGSLAILFFTSFYVSANVAGAGSFHVFTLLSSIVSRAIFLGHLAFHDAVSRAMPLGPSTTPWCVPQLQKQLC